MVTVLAWLQLLVAITLVFLIAIQDSKGGSSGMFGGGGGGNSLFGSTGAPNIMNTATKWLGGIFAILCFAFTIAIRNERGLNTGSVVESQSAAGSSATVPAIPNATGTAPGADNTPMGTTTHENASPNAAPVPAAVPIPAKNAPNGATEKAADPANSGLIKPGNTTDKNK